MMNILAEELNAQLGTSVAFRLLSDLGRRIYFPKGIIAQSGEAKKAAHRANATIGTAYSAGKPLILSCIADNLPQLTPAEAVGYAPTEGVGAVRTAWKQALKTKNPATVGALPDDAWSLPVVVPGLTAGISYVADLFLDANQPILMSGPAWDNYELIFTERRCADVRPVAFLTTTGLDVAGIERALADAAAHAPAVRVIFNFPNNPSGYTPTISEAAALVAAIRTIAEGGTDVLVICDDAYFSLFYEDDINRESLFGVLATLHERVLAVKIDGPTKEDYVWGLRMGFVSFGSKGMGPAHYDALIKKLMGCIRSSVSCANSPAQYLMLKTLADPRTAGEKARYQDILKRRYQAVKQFIASHPNHPRLTPLPFNSGYFMTFRCTGIDPEALRQKLLTDEGVGTIALEGQYLRAAFSSLEEAQIPVVYQLIYDTASRMEG